MTVPFPRTSGPRIIEYDIRFSHHYDGRKWSACGDRGIAAQARQGDALLFWDQTTNNEVDTFSLHAGCPVLRGVKWTATKWMHMRTFAAGVCCCSSLIVYFVS